MKKKVILVCSQCLARNYTVAKTAKMADTRMEIRKYCPRCNQYTLHKETK